MELKMLYSDYCIACDTCNKEAPGSGHSVAEARKSAKDAGFKQKGKNDICPKCFEEGKK
jgi:hypothetical protein